MNFESFALAALSIASTAFVFLLKHWFEILILILLYAIYLRLNCLTIILAEKLSKIDWLEEIWKENLNIKYEMQEQNKNNRISNKFKKF